MKGTAPGFGSGMADTVTDIEWYIPVGCVVFGAICFGHAYFGLFVDVCIYTLRCVFGWIFIGCYL